MPQHIPLKKLFDHQQGLRSDEFQTIENHLADCEHCTENMTLFSPHRRAQETKLASAHQREPANGKQADEREDGCPPPELIDRFISNSLPKRQQREVEKHLAICDACRRQLIAVFQASFAPVSEEEKKLLEALPPFELSEQVRQITNATSPPSGRFSSLIRRLSGWLDSHLPELRVPRPAWTVALVLVLGLAGKWWAWPVYQYYRLASQGESQLLEQNKIFYKGELRPAQGYGSSGEAELMSPENEKRTVAALLQEALAYDQDGEKARLRLAQYFLLQEMEGSADSLLKLLEAGSPPNAAVLNDRGIWLFKREQFDAAAAAFQRAYELNPRLDEALYNLAITQTQLGNIAAAEANWEKYMALENIKAEWRNAAKAQLQELREK
jgi:tetratricopeptide (TPR) repeat protein